MSNNRAEEGAGGNENTGRDGITVVATTESNSALVSSDGLGEQLIPGLPDDISLQLITPLLPWKEIISTLSSVSRAWQCVIRSHQVYDARVRSHSTEEFVIVHRYLSRPLKDSIALYSPRDKFCRYLPPIPHLCTGFPFSCQCVSLHGKIYILGGKNEETDDSPHGTKNDMGTEKVYVLDLYGHFQWKRCASMLFPRLDFGCGVLDGKIYVFGGSHFGRIFGESEMYDPEVDAWFPIKSLPSLRARHEVGTMGQELFVYGGVSYEELSKDGGEGEGGQRLVRVDGNAGALFSELYNPVMDTWTRIESFQTGFQRTIFLARGKLHSITDVDIHVYDIEKNSWTLSHTFSFPTIGPDQFIREGWIRVNPLAAVAVDDELLLRLIWWDNPEGEDWSCLFRSRGFGSQSERIVWETAEGSPSCADLSWCGIAFMAVADL